MTLPTPQPARLPALDILRGFALLGILVMNIQSFSMPEAAYYNPTLHGDLNGPNFFVWLCSRLFFDQKMMTIFSLLFGVGIGLQLNRVDRPALIHYRRMLVLLVIGLIHAYFVWFGDILVAYSLCGMLLYPLRRRSVFALITLGLLLLAAQNAVHFIVYDFGVPFAPLRDAINKLNFNRLSSGGEFAAYTANYRTEMLARVPAALTTETYVFIVYGFWRITGLMLLGLAAARAGIFSPAFPFRRFLVPLVLLAALGLTLTARAAVLAIAGGFSPESFRTTGLLDYWGSLTLGLVYAGLILALARTPLGKFLEPLAPVGRLALTNYLAQSLICTTIFYAHGLGYFGQMSRLGQIQTVLCIWTCQLAFSNLYLRYFRFGPAEWLWRTLTYGRTPNS